MKIGDKIYCIKPLKIEFSKTMSAITEIDDEYVLNEFGGELVSIKNKIRAFIITSEELNEHFANASCRRKIKLQKIMNNGL